MRTGAGKGGGLGSPAAGAGLGGAPAWPGATPAVQFGTAERTGTGTARKVKVFAPGAVGDGLALAVSFGKALPGVNADTAARYGMSLSDLETSAKLWPSFIYRREMSFIEAKRKLEKAQKEAQEIREEEEKRNAVRAQVQARFANKLLGATSVVQDKLRAGIKLKPASTGSQRIAVGGLGDRELERVVLVALVFVASNGYIGSKFVTQSGYIRGDRKQLRLAKNPNFYEFMALQNAEYFATKDLPEAQRRGMQVLDTAKAYSSSDFFKHNCSVLRWRDGMGGGTARDLIALKKQIEQLANVAIEAKHKFELEVVAEEKAEAKASRKRQREIEDAQREDEDEDEGEGEGEGAAARGGSAGGGSGLGVNQQLRFQEAMGLATDASRRATAQALARVPRPEETDDDDDDDQDWGHLA